MATNGLRLWKGNKKTKDYYFQDKTIKEYINISGTPFMFHKYVGPYKQDAHDSKLFYPENESDINEITIQDVLLGENRDRKYSDDIYEIYGTYTVSNVDFDLSQFGIMLAGDQLVIDFHTNETIDKLGRKPMNGDVLEVVHLRDDSSLDSESNIIKKYYVVQDSMRSAEGFGPTWHSHTWRIKCNPITDSQEYRDIFHKQNNSDDFDEIDWLTNFDAYTETDAGVKDNSKDENYDKAEDQSVYGIENRQKELRNKISKEEVEKRSFYVKHLYIRKDDTQARSGLLEWMLNNDDEPENYVGDYIESGTQFPENPEEGEYFIRNDYCPERLFKRGESSWKMVKDIWRRDWVPAHRILESFVNNDNITSIGNHEDQNFNERQGLSQVVKPKEKTTKGEEKDGQL